MAENLRTKIDNPTHYQDFIKDAYASQLEEREQYVDDGLSLVANGRMRKEAANTTQASPTHAYEVAQAIKPEIDKVVHLQERVDDPLAHAEPHQLDGSLAGYTGVPNPPELGIELKAAQLDLEQNAQKAAQLAERAYPEYHPPKIG